MNHGYKYLITKHDSGDVIEEPDSEKGKPWEYVTTNVENNFVFITWRQSAVN